MKSLVIEDDSSIVEAIRMAFKFKWPEVVLIEAATGMEGINKVRTSQADVIILDINLPDISGFEVLRKIREFSNVPVIILTVRADDEDVFRGLETGADDYITKPFNYMNLLARVKAVLRRSDQTDFPTSVDTSGRNRLKVDHISQRVWLNDQEIQLTPYEYKLLILLASNVGKIVTYQQITETVWGKEYSGNSEKVRIYIRRLRKKLYDEPPHIIVNQRHTGYMINN